MVRQQRKVEAKRDVRFKERTVPHLEALDKLPGSLGQLLLLGEQPLRLARGRLGRVAGLGHALLQLHRLGLEHGLLLLNLPDDARRLLQLPARRRTKG